MFPKIFQQTTIPALHEVMRFAQARHDVLAGNIANLNTPGYRVRDLSPDNFQRRLQEALETRTHDPDVHSPGFLSSQASFLPGEASFLRGEASFLRGEASVLRGEASVASEESRVLPQQVDEPWQQVRESIENILYHDDTNIDMEQQVAQLSKNQFMHNMAITVMNSQFRLLQTAISERV